VFVATNALAPDEFMRSFGRAGTIVTNSYHAAYWGLLSGRKVHIIGYSSKFVNLAALFGFPATSIVSVDRGDGLALNRAIARCADRAALQLAAPDRVKSQFRKHNLEFVRSLASIGVVASLKRMPAETPALADA
jgi:polysaccharide pyruvyl transferase WcaK-like protein